MQPVDRDKLERARQAVTRGARAGWWQRRGTPRSGFRYVDAGGKPITEEAQQARIRALALPPAWQEVRIAPSPRSPLQAVGIDKLGRVQYRYHATTTARREKRKYDKLLRFGANLPSLRCATNEDIAREGLGREQVLAVVVRLINDLYLRLGSESSVRQYRTYGVTTLRNRHLHIEPGGRLIFDFVGKHHVRQRRLLVDDELAALLRDIQALRGSRLFNYLGDDGRPHPVTPHDVNQYIKAAMGPEYSAKDFRTWGGTLLAAETLAEMGCPSSETQAKRQIAQAVRQVAERLGNTPTVCRSCYIHPLVIERYRQGVTLETFVPRRRRRITGRQPGLSPEEAALLRMLDGKTETPSG